MEPVEVPEPPFADPEAARIVHEDDPLLDNLRKKPPMRKKTWENESIVNNLPCEGGVGILIRWGATRFHHLPLSSF